METELRQLMVHLHLANGRLHLNIIKLLINVWVSSGQLKLFINVWMKLSLAG